MEILMSEAPFGRITSITGMSISIDIEGELLDRNLEQSKFVPYANTDDGDLLTLPIGMVGDIFLIGGPSTSDTIHYGIFEEVKLVSPSETHSTEKPKAVAIAKIIGYQDRNTKNHLSFRRGVGHYPRFNSKCYLLSPEEKRQLFSLNEGEGLEVGKITGVEDQPVFIHIDRFLSKHSVILGSTGSGKSSTVASVLQKVLKTHHYSHVLFFDLHNEYSNAFPSGNSQYKVHKVGASDLKIPYWFLNFEEFITVFLEDQFSNDSIRVLKEEIIKLMEESHNSIKSQVGNIEKHNINSPLYFSIEVLLNNLRKLNKRTLWKSDDSPALDEVGNYLPSTANKNIVRQDTGSNDNVLQDKTYYDKLTTIIEKIESVHQDNRYQFLFPTQYIESTCLYEYVKNLLSIPRNGEQTQLTILDLSKVPSEVSPLILGVLARLCFEYKLWEDDPKQLPVYLILEEAHNYIPRESNMITKLPKKYIERIAKEGRKYGLSQLIISQRPSDLSETVVAQCSNFIILRVTNPSDQNFVTHILPDHLSALSNMIPFFQNGEALIAGECVPIPTKVLIDPPNPEPNSSDVPFSSTWKILLDNYNLKNTIHNWWEIEKDGKTN